MADLVFVSIIVVFFVLCIAYLRWCDRIIGPDEFGAERDDVDSPYVATDATLVDAATTAEVTA
jgi:hypothetical protein